MRSLFIAIAGAALLAGCGNNDQTANTQNVDENLTAENIVANDVTAIDAVTGDAANMAADVNYTEIDNSLGNADNGAAPAPRKAPAKPPATAAPAENSPGNAAANATE
jgi:hypothetical protein